ncbi:MAG: hypothetical protein HONBIEJF_01907 [Fimbriimonadaceae bacterium]|nr:hypothetical protein [Fimbriimonadaceae bacterium]
MLVPSVWAITLLTQFGASPTNLSIVEAARLQVGWTTSYDPAYRRVAYPNGDVPISTGVCCDVVIRALRKSRGLDLQRLVIEDMRRAYRTYPQDWGQSRPDPNIDHRRVPNLATFFRRRGWALPLRDFRPGDIVTATLPRNLPHIMVVSDRRNRAGVPLVIHNIGGGVKEEDRLFEHPLTGHFRLKPD